MKIGYMVPFGSNPMAELETRIRFKYCVEKLGHDFIELNMDGFDIDSGIHAEDLMIDFIFSHDTAVCAEKPLPDIFSVFAHWSPNGFLVSADFMRYFVWMSKYDMVIGGYESPNVFRDVSNHPDAFTDFYNITSSISKDFVLPPRRKKNLKLFYVGINLEKIQRGGTRYIKLLKYLDDLDCISIYGPNETLGATNLWQGFKNYNGEIPFDGHSIIKRINEAGIALALNSPVHSYVGTVSNRIYEAAAAGAVIISDNNEYVKRYFGDSVFYIDIEKSEDEQIKDIKKILKFIGENPEKAYEMAVAAQKIFINQLSLDQQVNDLFPFLSDRKRSFQNLSRSTIDVICFVDKYSEYQSVMKEIKKQYHKNLRIFICSNLDCIKKIKKAAHHENITTIVRMNEAYGEIFWRLREQLTSDYFIFVDQSTSMHMDHISKLSAALEKSNSLYAYTGIYLKHISQKGTVLGYEPYSIDPLTNDEMCSFLRISSTDENIMFNIEERFSISCCMFKREIMDIVEENEIVQIGRAVHFYLACASIIKKKLDGHFVYAISCGYKLAEEMTIQDIFKKDRNLNYLYHKTEKTYFKDLFLVFFKYDYAVNPIPWGFPVAEAPSHSDSIGRKLIRKIKKIIPKRLKEFIKKIIFT